MDFHRPELPALSHHGTGLEAGTAAAVPVQPIDRIAIGAIAGTGNTAARAGRPRRARHQIDNLKRVIFHLAVHCHVAARHQAALRRPAKPRHRLPRGGRRRCVHIQRNGATSAVLIHAAIVGHIVGNPLAAVREIPVLVPVRPRLQVTAANVRFMHSDRDGIILARAEGRQRNAVFVVTCRVVIMIGAGGALVAIGVVVRRSIPEITVDCFRHGVQCPAMLRRGITQVLVEGEGQLCRIANTGTAKHLHVENQSGEGAVDADTAAGGAACRTAATLATPVVVDALIGGAMEAGAAIVHHKVVHTR